MEQQSLEELRTEDASIKDEERIQVEEGFQNRSDIALQQAECDEVCRT